MPDQLLAAAASPPMRKLSVLMPVYNEQRTLATIVARVLASPAPLEIEIIAVDDGSTDGSREILERLQAADARLHVVRHVRNRGKGAAVRTAILHMSGDVAVIQDADLEYDPAAYPRLLAPILSGQADAVFGSRFLGRSRRSQSLTHGLANRLLTFLSNRLNHLQLTDMETCYKMIRADVLRGLRLKSQTFTIEPEITCRLAQGSARIVEAPISYRGRAYRDGKKIRPIDGVKALYEMVRCAWIDRPAPDAAGRPTPLASTPDMLQR